MNRWFEFCPNRSFFELKILWATILFVLLIAAVPLILITVGSNLEWNFSYEGFNQAITIFKVPLGITALLIPLVAILAANHRSVQNKEAMRLAQAQNTFANYYKHREEFIKHCSAIEKTYESSKIKIRSIGIHEKLFSNAKSGDFNADSTFIASHKEIIETIINRIREHREAFRKTQKNEQQGNLTQENNQTAICLKINAEKLKKYIQINDTEIPIIAYKKEKNILNINPYPIQNLNVIYFISTLIYRVAEFEFQSSKELEKLTQFLFEHIQNLDPESPLSKIENHTST